MNIFKILKNQRITRKFYRDYIRLQVQDKLVHFDHADFSFLDGKYWHGLPLYYYLTEYMSMGRCYDASTALGLAMGKGAYIVRGDLKSMEGAWGKEKTGHGWVEFGDKVYDTTWQIICDKEDYYKVFRPKVLSIRSYEEFKKDLSKITDTEIKTKEWYEENPSSANILIFQIRALEMKKLKSETLSKKEKAFSKKVLQDLPKVSLKELDAFIEKELRERELLGNWEM